MNMLGAAALIQAAINTSLSTCASAGFLCVCKRKQCWLKNTGIRQSAGVGWRSLWCHVGTVVRAIYYSPPSTLGTHCKWSSYKAQTSGRQGLLTKQVQLFHNICIFKHVLHTINTILSVNLKHFFSLKQISRISGSWNRGSAVKSAVCSPRGPGFDLQHPHSSTNQLYNSSPRRSDAPFWPLCVLHACGTLSIQR